MIRILSLTFPCSLFLARSSKKNASGRKRARFGWQMHSSGCRVENSKQTDRQSNALCKCSLLMTSMQPRRLPTCVNVNFHTGIAHTIISLVVAILPKLKPNQNRPHCHLPLVPRWTTAINRVKDLLTKIFIAFLFDLHLAAPMFLLFFFSSAASLVASLQIADA